LPWSNYLLLIAFLATFDRLVVLVVATGNQLAARYRLGVWWLRRSRHRAWRRDAAAGTWMRCSYRQPQRWPRACRARAVRERHRRGVCWLGEPSGSV